MEQKLSIGSKDFKHFLYLSTLDAASLYKDFLSILDKNKLEGFFKSIDSFSSLSPGATFL